MWQVAATLVHAAFDSNVKVHKQSQAVRTLQYLYTNKTLVADRNETEAATLEQDLYSRVIKVSDMARNGGVMKSFLVRRFLCTKSLH